MSLEVIPEELPVISAALLSHQASLTTVLGAQELPAIVGATTAMVSQCDEVSQSFWGDLLGYQQLFLGATTEGIAHLVAGANVLIPVGLDYATSDVSGGAGVGAAGSRVLTV
ncbi:hypothetical protein [Nocardia sp. NBC_00511]|uniref:hypothetical protein n=1 Tax=Nocardia sp. NBC_00511 TaxID=2903591 RepID=UPI002F9175AB